MFTSLLTLRWLLAAGFLCSGPASCFQLLLARVTVYCDTQMCIPALVELGYDIHVGVLEMLRT